MVVVGVFFVVSRGVVLFCGSWYVGVLLFLCMHQKIEKNACACACGQMENDRLRSR